MKTYSQFVNETFDTRANWRETKIGNSIFFTSTIDRKEVKLEFIPLKQKSGINLTLVEFEVDGSQEVTGTGSANKIFGAVINKIAEYVDEHKPEKVNFTAVKHVGEAGKEKSSRINLYKRLLTRKFAKTEYKSEISPWRGTTSLVSFLLTRKD